MHACAEHISIRNRSFQRTPSSHCLREIPFLHWKHACSRDNASSLISRIGSSDARQGNRSRCTGQHERWFLLATIEPTRWASSAHNPNQAGDSIVAFPRPQLQFPIQTPEWIHPRRSLTGPPSLMPMEIKKALLRSTKPRHHPSCALSHWNCDMKSSRTCLQSKLPSYGPELSASPIMRLASTSSQTYASN